MRALTDFPMVDIRACNGCIVLPLRDKGGQRALSDRETTAFPTGLKIVRLWTMASSSPSGLEDVFLSDSSRLNHDGVNEPNDGKAVMECEENLGLGTVDRSELQVLTGVGITVIPWAFVKDRRVAARRGITHTALLLSSPL
jgi:hypothetical protein